MRNFVVFLGGAVLGLLMSGVLLYFSSYIMMLLGVQFFENESDQQRNFNLFLVGGFLFSIVGGYLAVKRFKKVL